MLENHSYTSSTLRGSLTGRVCTRSYMKHTWATLLIDNKIHIYLPLATGQPTQYLELYRCLQTQSKGLSQPPRYLHSNTYHTIPTVPLGKRHPIA